MSSTQLDLSPTGNDRQQDITSWPEIDVTGLTTRDRNRYNRRKSAIQEYFQTNRTVEEITATYRLSSRDPLEKLARNCCLLHEDGQVWGFRALVPGVTAIDHSLPVETTGEDTQPIEEKSNQPGNEEDVFAADLTTLLEEDEEDTAKRQAVRPVQPAVQASETAPEPSTADLPQAVDAALEDASAMPGEETVTTSESDQTASVQESTPVVRQASFIEELETVELATVTPLAPDALQASEQAHTSDEDEDAASEQFSLSDIETVTIQAVASPDSLRANSTDEDEPEQFSLSDIETVTIQAISSDATQPPTQADSTDEDKPELPSLSEIETVTIQAVAPGSTTASEQVDAPGENGTETSGQAASSAEVETVTQLAVIAEQKPVEVVDAFPVKAEGATAEQATEDASLAADETTSQADLPVDARKTLALAAARQRDSRQLAAARALNLPAQSLIEESRYRLTGSQAAIRRSVRKRWDRLDKKQKHQRAIKIMSAAIVVAILVILLIPLAVGLVGYNAYTNIKGVANDGLNNLMSIQALVPANKSDITSVLNAQKLAQAKTNLAKSQSDFRQLQDMVNRPDIQSLLQEFAPQYASELGQASHLIQVALDVTSMGQELIGVAQIATNIVHGGALLSSGSTTPLISADDINTIEATLVHAQYYISDIQTQMSQVNLAQLPFGSPAQKAKILKYLPELASAQSAISQAQSMIGPVSWLLGVGQARNFLVQTLDRGELRSSGGFEGQYGILTLTNGRMSPFTLKDVTLIDYDENGAELGNHPPSQYKWMDFGNFGVRDANLSADYPTTAQLVMKTFEQEGGGPLDGDIQITPVVIEQLLQLTGPVTLSDYGQTVTSQNLETLIHKYQQDYQFISQEQQVTGTNTHETRKAFTSQLGETLLARVKGLSISQLMSFGKVLLTDLKSRDLQVYFTNPVAEQWLVQNGDSGAMPSLSNGVDGFMVVQANISISKASQFVHSTFNDQVTLDAQGNAHHTLTVTLNYARNNNPVYGYNTYADYVRVYVPSNAQLISSYGFDTGSVLCTPNSGKAPPKTGTGTGNGNGGTGTTNTSTGSGSYIDDINGLNKVVYGCGQYYHSYPEEDYRDCSSTGNYELGYDGMVGTPWPVRNVGGASSTSSDLPGYKMWGGMTLTPTNCTTTLTFQWETPNVVQNTAGQSPYQMIVGHQAGWPDTMQVHIDASALKGGIKSVTENETINDDTLVTLANRPLPTPPSKTPTPTPAVTPTTKPKK